MNVLFIESGSLNGGSFESLYLHLRHAESDYVQPHVLFLNDTSYEEKFRAIGVATYVRKDLVFSRSVPSVVRRGLDFLRRLSGRVAPRSYVWLSNLFHAPLIWAILKICKEQKIDLVHLNNSIGRDLYGATAANLFGIPCVSHLRARGGLDSRDSKWLSFTDGHVSRYIANSQATKSYWTARGLAGQKIQVVHNAVASGDVEPKSLQMEWGFDPGPAICTVGRLSPSKGHEYLLQIFAGIRQLYPTARLLIVGDGPCKSSLQASVERLNLHESVVFTGYRQDATELMAACDLSIIPSQQEPFGRVVIESMQAGTPLIATRVGGIPEIVNHMANGLLVDYGDVPGAVRLADTVLSDPDLRRALINNGRETVSEQFSVQRYIYQVESIYENVMGR